MTIEITNGGGAQTLDIKQPEWQDRGYGVIGDVDTPGSGPLAISINTGSLGTGNAALSVGSGDALVDGATVSFGGGTVDIEPGDADPRKDLIWIDSGGSIQVEQGQPTPIKPQGASGFGSWSPAVPFPATTPAVCLGAVFVPGNASAISEDELQDRRLSANTIRSAVNSDSVSTEDITINSGMSYPSQIPQDVTGSRSRGTWYQNSHGQAIEVYVVLQAQNTGDRLNLTFDINDSQTSNAFFSDRVDSSDSDTERNSDSFVVPSEAYYRVRDVNDGVLDRWYEQKIGAT